MARKIVFAWGRFNPPTTGHKVVMDRVAKEARARKADYAIFASKSNEPKKNPLTFRTKVKFLKQSFPKHAKNINASPRLKTVIDVMKSFDKKYQEVSLVVGADRAQEFKKLLNHYNGREYDFEEIEIISAGERDPDSDDVTGMSASKMRKAAAEGDYASFRKGSPMKNSKELYNAIRRGMKINEEICNAIVEANNVDVTDRSIAGRRFNAMLRFGLVPIKFIPITRRAFSDLEQAAPNPELRKHILDVTDKVLEYIMADDLLYRRMLLLLHDNFLMKEDHRDALLMKAEKSRLSYTSLLEVFLRGLAASPIYGDKTAHQYAFDRVNSFIAGGHSRNKLDADIWESNQQKSIGRTPMKRLRDVNPPAWGTKEMADRYSSVTPGQPDDTAEIMVSSHETVRESAPPGAEAEAFIENSKEKFKKRYGDKWEQVLYATAWKVYGKNESVDEAKKSEQNKRLDKAGKRYRASLTKTVPAGQPYSKTDAAYKRAQKIKVELGKTRKKIKHTITDRTPKGYGPSEEVEEAMSPKDIERARKAQKRELVRGKRKSGKTSDKMYDYLLRKSQGKPVNVPKNNNQTEEVEMDEMNRDRFSFRKRADAHAAKYPPKSSKSRDKEKRTTKSKSDHPTKAELDKALELTRRNQHKVRARTPIPSAPRRSYEEVEEETGLERYDKATVAMRKRTAGKVPKPTRGFKIKKNRTAKDVIGDLRAKHAAAAKYKKENEGVENVDEAKMGDIARAVKKGPSPYTIVAIQGKKVVATDYAKIADQVPAIVRELKKEFPKAKIGVESRSGKMLHTESFVGEAKVNFKVGDIVIAKSGLHKGEKHKVIHVFKGKDKYNIQPVGAIKVKYRLGAAGAKGSDLKLAENDEYEIEEGGMGGKQSNVTKTGTHSSNLNYLTKSKSKGWSDRGRSSAKEKKRASREARQAGKKLVRDFKEFSEASFMVNIEGIGKVVIDGTSASEIKASLRKKLRNKDDFGSVERIGAGSKKKHFMSKATGKEEEPENEE